MILYLIRHGKTKCNEERLYCGKTDIDLSNGGIKELNDLKKKISYPICENNYTSGAKRANQTFEILYPGSLYTANKEFFEYDFGDFELKSYEDLKEDINYINWITDESQNIKCPNGESKRDFKDRLENAFQNFIKDLEKNNIKEALILCHGGVIGTLLQNFYSDEKDFYSYQPSFGRGYKVRVNTETLAIEVLEEI